MRAPTRRPLRVGDQCLACDKGGVWYAAKVLDERGEGAARELHVHFTGWRGRFDEWVSEARAQRRPKGSVKAALARANWKSTDGHDEASDSWVVERILNKKMARGRASYLVKWQGWADASNSWEPAANILDRTLIEEYERPRSRKPAAAAARKDPKPFTDDFAAAAAVWPLEIMPWRDAAARACFSVLTRTRVAAARTKLYELDPCPPELYVNLHRSLRDEAKELQLAGTSRAAQPDPHPLSRHAHELPVRQQAPDESAAHATRPHHPPCAGDLDAHVGPRRAKLGGGGGDKVHDVFLIKSADVVERLLDEFNGVERGGALVVDARTNILKMLLPPLSFSFETQRSGYKPRTRLVVKGNVGCLRPPTAGQGAAWSFGARYDEKLASGAYRKAVVRQAFKIAFKTAAERIGAPTIPGNVLTFLDAV